MKKYFFTIATLVFIVACGTSNNGPGKDSTAVASSAETSGGNDVTTNPDYKKGLDLVAANDCFTCHKIDEKLTGPAYRDVANKYDNTNDNTKMLAGKIIKGGSGVWGSMAMTAHTALSEADAEQMVKYILLLRNK